MKELDRAMTPILADLMTLGPESNNHPSVRQFSTWLIDAQRTGEDIHHVIGPLQHQVRTVMLDHFEDSMYQDISGGCDKYIGKVAAEFLVVKNPVLEGIWGQVAWTLTTTHSTCYINEMKQESSRLRTWMINVVADEERCPTPNLR